MFQYSCKQCKNSYFEIEKMLSREPPNLKSNSIYNFQQSKYYSTRFEPPKKETKEKKLSNGIKKFLAKKEAEEREKEESRKRQFERLMEMRSEKDKNKIKKMLKVTKSANRSVLDDAVNTTDTALTLQGPEQPDEDDYGYTSHESSALYRNLMDKYKTIPEDKKFSESSMRGNKNGDLMSTKDRVRAAIMKEKEDEHSGRKRQSTSTPSSSSNHSESEQRHRSRKNLYDPKVEREEEERRKKEEDAQRRKMKPKRPPPQVMDFNKLLELAREKQHQPIEIEVKPQKPKEPERLLTAKEKREMEARKAHIEGKDRKNVASNRPLNGTDNNRRADQPTNGRIPKLPGATQKPSSSSIDCRKLDMSGAKDFKTAKSIRSSSQSSTPKTYLPHPSKKPSQTDERRPPIDLKSRGQESLERSLPKPATNSRISSQGRPLDPKSVRPREFPPKDVTKSTEFPPKSRQFPPKDVAKSRDFPPKDLQRSREFPPRDMAMKKKQKQMAQKRRILDSDSEYDSEMDDFIDDDDAGMDFSSHIKEIFGYDKSRYRDDDADIDGMESNFAQVSFLGVFSLNL